MRLQVQCGRTFDRVAAQNRDSFFIALAAGFGAEVQRVTAELVGQPLRVVIGQRHFLQRDHVRLEFGQLSREDRSALRPARPVIQDIERDEFECRQSLTGEARIRIRQHVAQVQSLYEELLS